MRDDVRSHAAHAERLRARHSTPPPDEPERARRTREKLLEVAAAIEAEAAAAVLGALRGRYDSGKSTLLGNLLGNIRLLPAADEPATAHTTTLVLVPGEVRQAQLADDRVDLHFMDGPQVDRCLADLRDRLVRVVRGNLDDRDTADALAACEPVRQHWDEFDRLCATYLWRSASTPELEAREAALEMVLLRDALWAAGGLLGQRRSLTWAQWRETCAAGETRAASQPYPASRRGHVRALSDPALVRAGAALILEAVCRVEVPPEFWAELELDQGQAVELRDLPGTRARRSRNRDRFVADLAVRDAHAVLDLVQAQHVSADDARSPSPVPAILAITHFDQVRPPQDPLPPTLAELLATPGNERLAGICGLVEREGSIEKAAFVSSVRALAAAGTPDDGQQVWSQRRLRWQGVAAHLRQTDRSVRAQAFTTVIEDYCRDDGIGRLRRLLGRHLQERGLATKLARLAALRAELDELDGRHAEQMAPPVSMTDETYRALQGIIREARRKGSGLARQIRSFTDPLSEQGPLAELRALDDRLVSRVLAWDTHRHLRVNGGPRSVADLEETFHLAVNDIVADVRTTIADQLADTWLPAAASDFAELRTAAQTVPGPVDPDVARRLRDLMALPPALAPDLLRQKVTGWPNPPAWDLRVSSAAPYASDPYPLPWDDPGLKATLLLHELDPTRMWYAAAIRGASAQRVLQVVQEQRITLMAGAAGWVLEILDAWIAELALFERELEAPMGGSDNGFEDEEW
ncbi:hypothetical protein [Parafrankia sp. EUN1f]|uniref:hypothetical protein n=1 Tax=Parafrankia sp. EUN1f TaxID=102897 RepID=UPI0012F7F8AD|nr:hypothetical protein [Parafrankia sp. EUN1f]